MFIAYLVVLSTVCVSALRYSVMGRKGKGPSRIVCFFGRGDGVMRGGTVSVLRASCDSTGRRKKYKRRVR